MTVDKMLIDLILTVIAGASIFAVLRSKVETHHRVLFGDHSELLVVTSDKCDKRHNDESDQCDERHAKELINICLKIDVVKTDMKAIKDRVDAYGAAIESNNQLMAGFHQTMIDFIGRLQIENERKTSDPKSNRRDGKNV